MQETSTTIIMKTRYRNNKIIILKVYILKEVQFIQFLFAFISYAFSIQTEFRAGIASFKDI